MMAKFSEHGVVPDVLSVAPASIAEVVWPSGAKAELGNVLTPTQVRKRNIITEHDRHSLGVFKIMASFPP